ncbi:glucosamine-6-phosphate deaminase [Sporosarcina luteola]|uniref:glucosamine-6-phosphate deaminase n=1 Tax=Sporosarcina luteola TaxID=582850 RepID=UPI0020405C58|nr:glucosamine-6-phosphate deaminase [Sporosarcina luteola]
MNEVYEFDWVKVADFDEMSSFAAKLYERQLLRKPDSVLGLATGASPVGFYEKLVERHAQGTFSFAQTHTFNLDEYIGLQPSHPTSFHNYMEEHLFTKVDLPVTSRHLPDGMADDLNEACLRYETLMRISGGIDMQLLGIGINGHIGFNEPYTSFRTRTHIVDLADSTRTVNAKYFPSKEAVPRQAITMGIETILEAEQIILLAFGEQKVEAVERLKSGVISEDFPASCLHRHPHVTVFFGK